MLVAFGCTLVLRRRGERYVSTGTLLIGIAAFIGMLRFGVNPELADLHRFVSALATCAGLPLMAVQYASTRFGWPGRDGRMNTMGASVVGFAAFGLAFPVDLYPTVVGALAMIVVLVAGLATLPGPERARGAMAAVGALLFALAGLVVGTTGTLGPFLRIDVFHAVLCVAVGLLAAGLPERPADW
ncbi:MAG: hypothetical protein KC656_01550 [Myxococcales bacterium]|nr:hypothetical protein [Myxococcales bacterium]MCB9669691.1 hypothetical protein [Alphaproteobacteria bacterium]MCB9672781.1 hypothetical protein [Alphaproteobacteria bacterium]MCB9694709.1 hypothetical protein [Alphaproteobacteria bacterium]